MKRSFDPRVYLVTDRPLCKGRDVLDVVREAVAGGVTMVQLREKEAGTREFVDLARRVKALLDPLGVLLVINDRVDVALASGAGGVHVGQSDMEAADARRLMGPGAIIGLSIDKEPDLEKAEPLDVDYLGVGPVFATQTKKDAGPALGLETLALLCQRTRHPVVAIGAMGPDNAGLAIRAGARGVAAVSAVCSADSPRQAAQGLRIAVDKALGS